MKTLKLIAASVGIIAAAFVVINFVLWVYYVGSLIFYAFEGRGTGDFLPWFRDILKANPDAGCVSGIAAITLLILLVLSAWQKEIGNLFTKKTKTA
jgi:hypothetical protein